MPATQDELPEVQSTSRLKPFLRWAGGKRRLAILFKNYVPNSFGDYWEPFLGSGALYFSMSPESAHLSDSNVDLINCYKYIRDYPGEIFSELRNHSNRTCETYYYVVRDLYNKSDPSIAQAARFLYLNKTSFNGIFRVNIEGEYNVPYGHKEPPSLPTLAELRSISKLLKHARLKARSFELLEHDKHIKTNDFVYLDPPYPPINGTSTFTHYTMNRFSWKDQERVAEIAKALSQKGSLVMVSNTDVQKIRDLYNGWYFVMLPVIRSIAANGTRHKVNELVITNYPIHEDRISGKYNAQE